MQFHLDNVNTTIAYIKSWGALGPLVTFILFFVQAVAPVFPYLILAGAAGLLFGIGWGFLLAWIGALLGAVAEFLVSKKLGKKWFMARLYSKYEIDLSEVDDRVWFWSIVIARVFPIIPTPAINIGSGLAGVRFRTFFLSSAIGKIPTAIIYTALGDNLRRTHDLAQTILWLVAILVVSFIGMYCFKDKVRIFRKREEK